MRHYTLRKTVETIATFEHRNNSALTEFVGEIDNDARHVLKPLRRDVELTQDIVAHAVKTGANEDQLRLEFARLRHETCLEDFQKLCVSLPGGIGTLNLVPFALPAPVSSGLPVPGYAP